jgi:hypothetical protein
MTLSRDEIDKIARASADEITTRMGEKGSHAPYSEQGWKEHIASFTDFLKKVRSGQITVQAGYITNPNYGGYSYKEGIDSKIFGSVSYAEPSEVLVALETAGIKEVSLAGDFWERAGHKGWGEKVPVSLAKEKLSEWRAIFLGGLPERKEKRGGSSTASSSSKKKPTRDDVRVEVWEERDRLHIGIQDKKTGDYYASWWDDEAREMFEQGFFKSGRGLEASVLEYAEDMGILAK